MYYNYYQSAKSEFEECTSKGICSINPILSSLQEVILLHLKELAFYLVKLKQWGVSNEKIKEDVLEALSGIIINAEYNQEQLHSIIGRLHNDIFEAKELYKKMSQKHKMEISFLKTYFRHKKARKFSLPEAIKRGEKYFLKKISLFNQEQKNLFDIMLFLIKSLCIKIVELKSFGKDYEEGYSAILTMLNSMNFQEFLSVEIKKEIEKFIGVYYEVVKMVYYSQVEAYGEMEQVEVSLSTRPGKAILVSGSSLKELESVLEATKDKEIDVYTHGIEMLNAHSFPKFRTYKNLRGHFSTGVGNNVFDFATFPGTVLMTRHSLEKIEYLYQGRLFTSDLIAPRGVVKIHENDLEPLVQSALAAKGFAHGRQKNSLTVGYSEEAVMRALSPVFDRIERGEIKHIYVIGLLNDVSCHRQYFDIFMKLIPKDCYVLSLAYEKVGENIFHINSVYEYSLIYKILRKMKEKKPLSDYDMSVFITKCDKYTIANILNLKNMGVKNIYMCKCSPVLVNPALINAMRNVFGVNEFFDPQEDIKKTLTQQN